MSNISFLKGASNNLSAKIFEHLTRHKSLNLEAEILTDTYSHARHLRFEQAQLIT